MKKIRDVAVIGCGRFGYHLAITLSQMGRNVIVVDDDEEIINSLANQVSYAICADVTQENVLAEIGIGNCDVAIIAIGEEFEAAMMATLACKDLGVPRIIAKARNESMGRVLRKIGATQVVIPERDQGIKLAHSLASHNMADLIGLSTTHAILEVICPPPWCGKSLKQLQIRSHYGVTVIGIERVGEPLLVPNPDYVFREGDRVYALGSNEDLAKIETIIDDE
ncbi:MAG TPA: TrkA family potassium uptake protein [Clostridia bacterium]|nr:TrkA family potassium uptake protein [Clostridia bacterium]